MTVEDALRWAYREELPKAASQIPILKAGPQGCRSSGSMVDMVAEIWALPDNGFGVVGLPIDLGEPHPDAILIDQAVGALTDVEVAIADRCDLLDDLGDLPELAEIADRAVALVAKGGQLREALRSLILRFAILGAPDTSAAAPERKAVKGANGRDQWFRERRIEVAGSAYVYEEPCRSRDAGAYQKFVLEPDPLDAALARAEYEVWRAALDLVYDDIAGRLQSITLLPSAMPQRPWEPEGPRHRVLRDRTRRAAEMADIRGAAPQITAAPLRRKSTGPWKRG